MRTAVRTVLKGTRYYDAGKMYRGGLLRVGEMLRLQHNPGNAHDKYAVEAYLASSGAMLGHISKDYSRKYSELLVQGAVLSAKVSEVSGTGNEIRIEVEIQYEGGNHNHLHGSRIWKASEKLPASPGVYRLCNDATKEMYIGSSNNVRSRVKDHIKALESGCHSNRFLQDSYGKSGPNLFGATVLVECSGEQLLISEEKEIKKAMSAGYHLLNMTETGQGVKPKPGSGPGETISNRDARRGGDRSPGLSEPANVGATRPAQNDRESAWPSIVGWLIFLLVLYLIFFGGNN